MESRNNFRRRCEVATGLLFEEIPQTKDERFLLGGAILCRRGDQYLVTVGYPNSDQMSFWGPDPKNFVIILLGNEEDEIMNIQEERNPEVLLHIAARCQDRGWVKAHALAMEKAIQLA